jgi:hypothetical protein
VESPDDVPSGVPINLGERVGTGKFPVCHQNIAVKANGRRAGLWNTERISGDRMSDEMQQLNGEWHRVYGTDIPYRVAIHGPDEIRKALKHGRKQLQPVSGTIDKDADLVFEDTRNNLT